MVLYRRFRLHNKDKRLQITKKKDIVIKNGLILVQKSETQCFKIKISWIVVWLELKIAYW